jgi:hypothetical protein
LVKRIERKALRRSAIRDQRVRDSGKRFGVIPVLGLMQP